MKDAGDGSVSGGSLGVLLGRPTGQTSLDATHPVPFDCFGPQTPAADWQRNGAKQNSGLWQGLAFCCDSNGANCAGRHALQQSPIQGSHQPSIDPLTEPDRRGRWLTAPTRQSGKATTKRAPPPGRASQCTWPPWRSAMVLTSDRPRPTPPSRSLAPGRR